MVSDVVEFQAVSPIGNSDPRNLPVRDLEAALPFYQEILGFTVIARTDHPQRSATLYRDAVTLALVENGGDPEQASCYIAVSNVEGARAELDERHLDISPIRVDQYGGQAYRVFFLRVPDGLCYCIGQKA
jgi:lactoylglutathione lyase